jgi:hypothetical protein
LSPSTSQRKNPAQKSSPKTQSDEELFSPSTSPRHNRAQKSSPKTQSDEELFAPSNSHRPDLKSEHTGDLFTGDKPEPERHSPKHNLEWFEDDLESRPSAGLSTRTRGRSCDPPGRPPRPAPDFADDPPDLADFSDSPSSEEGSEMENGLKEWVHSVFNIPVIPSQATERETEDAEFAFRERLCAVLQIEIVTDEGSSRRALPTRLNAYLDNPEAGPVSASPKTSSVRVRDSDSGSSEEDAFAVETGRSGEQQRSEVAQDGDAVPLSPMAAIDAALGSDSGSSEEAVFLVDGEVEVGHGGEQQRSDDRIPVSPMATIEAGLGSDSDSSEKEVFPADEGEGTQTMSAGSDGSLEKPGADLDGDRIRGAPATPRDSGEEDNDVVDGEDAEMPEVGPDVDRIPISPKTAGETGRDSGEDGRAENNLVQDAKSGTIELMVQGSSGDFG